MNWTDVVNRKKRRNQAGEEEGSEEEVVTFIADSGAVETVIPPNATIHVKNVGQWKTIRGGRRRRHQEHEHEDVERKTYVWQALKSMKLHFRFFPVFISIA